MAAGKPRLLVLASTYPRWRDDVEPGFVHELARRLTDVFEVSVITPHAAGALVDESLDGVAIHRYRYAPAALETLVHGGGIVSHLRRSPWKFALVPGFVLAQWLSARRLLRRQPPALIHAHWLIPQGLIARAVAGRAVPYVVTSHGADLFALPGAWFARLRRWVMQRASKVTVVSAAMQAKVRQEAPDTPVVVLPMGVDAEQLFTPDPAITRDSDELLFVGRLVEKKGLRHLLAALPAVIAQRPSVRLTIAGFGPELSALQGLVEQLGLAAHVRFLGAVAQPQLPALYRRAGLFVAPFIAAESGDQEGLGLVVAEAMACACPVLVGDVPAVHDLVDADTGVIVPATEHARLAAAINALLDDAPRCAQLAAQGRRHVLERYSWTAVAARYRDLLLSVAASALPRK